MAGKPQKREPAEINGTLKNLDEAGYSRLLVAMSLLEAAYSATRATARSALKPWPNAIASTFRKSLNWSRSNSPPAARSAMGALRLIETPNLALRKLFASARSFTQARRLRTAGLFPTSGNRDGVSVAPAFEWSADTFCGGPAAQRVGAPQRLLTLSSALVHLPFTVP